MIVSVDVAMVVSVGVAAHRDDDLVHQRHAQARDLDEVTARIRAWVRRPRSGT